MNQRTTLVRGLLKLKKAMYFFNLNFKTLYNLQVCLILIQMKILMLVNFLKSSLHIYMLKRTHHVIQISSLVLIVFFKF